MLSQYGNENENTTYSLEWESGNETLTWWSTSVCVSRSQSLQEWSKLHTQHKKSDNIIPAELTAYEYTYLYTQLAK